MPLTAATKACFCISYLLGSAQIQDLMFQLLLLINTSIFVSRFLEKGTLCLSGIRICYLDFEFDALLHGPIILNGGWENNPDVWFPNQVEPKFEAALQNCWAILKDLFATKIYFSQFSKFLQFSTPFRIHGGGLIQNSTWQEKKGSNNRQLAFANWFAPRCAVKYFLNKIQEFRTRWIRLHRAYPNC